MLKFLSAEPACLNLSEDHGYPGTDNITVVMATTRIVSSIVSLNGTYVFALSINLSQNCVLARNS